MRDAAACICIFWSRRINIFTHIEAFCAASIHTRMTMLKGRIVWHCERVQVHSRRGEDMGRRRHDNGMGDTASVCARLLEKDDEGHENDDESKEGAQGAYVMWEVRRGTSVVGRCQRLFRTLDHRPLPHSPCSLTPLLTLCNCPPALPSLSPVLSTSPSRSSSNSPCSSSSSFILIPSSCCRPIESDRASSCVSWSSKMRRCA